MAKRPFERPIIKRLQTGMPGKFGTRREFEPLSHIDGVSVTDLMAQYGSPLFLSHPSNEEIILS